MRGVTSAARNRSSNMRRNGEVTAIGLRSVRLVTPDDSLVSVPNSDIVNQAVSNSNSGEFNCQVVAELYLPVRNNFV